MRKGEILEANSMKGYSSSRIRIKRKKNKYTNERKIKQNKTRSEKR